MIFLLDTLEVDEPIGWSDLNLVINRDEQWQGIFFEAGSVDLGFYGAGANYLRSLKQQYGFDAQVTLSYTGDCGEVITGKLDFGRYREDCGASCIVYVSFEQVGCLMTLRNRYDQKVDIDQTVGFDKQTQLTPYAGVNMELALPAKELIAAAYGFTDPAYEESLEISGLVLISMYNRPVYGKAIYESIVESQLLNPTITTEFFGDPFALPVTPQVLFDDNVTCFDGNFSLDIRMKGRMIFDLAQNNGNIRYVLGTWDGVGDIFADLVEIANIGLVGPINSSGTFEFDYTDTRTITLAQGIGLYAFIAYGAEQGSLNAEIVYDPETYFNLSANKACPASLANVSLVHEALSRIVEIITDGCFKVKSEYYGRVDSQPYSFDQDGCGALRVISSGLKIRRAETPKHFISLQDAFKGLRGIDNIGMGLEGNDVRIEPVEYFYNDTELLKLAGIPEAQTILDPNYAYSTINIGYAKWEVQNVNGLDEPNSNKEFRTGLSSIRQNLDAVSNFVAGSYPIEITRQQSYADSGGADTSYDNETFIICVVRNGYYAYQVEQGGEGITGVYSPDTLYNWRIRPRFNLMRWWKSIIQSYASLINTSSKLFFQAGTGNLVAAGSLDAYDPCKLETVGLAENADMARQEFLTEPVPIYKPERITFSYPLSIKDYNFIKANPYGYISVQCGNGEYVKGYILSIQYRPAEGQADFNLLLKW